MKYEKDITSGQYLKSCIYDNKFRIKTEKNENTSGSWATISYGYYPDGRLQYKEIKDKNTTTLLAREEYAYNNAFDADNNGIADFALITKTIKGDTNSPDIVTKTCYDKHGRVLKDSRMLDSTEYTDTFTYDYIGNKVQEKQARAYEESYSNTWTAQYRYDFAGRLIETTDINNNKSTVEYDICYKVSI